MKNTTHLLATLMLALIILPVWSATPWRGSMTPYDLNVTPAPVPDSLRAVGIVHVARHGARYMTSPKSLKSMRTALEDARSRGTVTQTGIKMLSVIEMVDSLTGGQWGMLDSIGRLEETALARNMRNRFPRLLRMGRVIARSSYVPRAIQSMYSFTYTLARLSPYLNIVTHEGPRQDSLLRFFDTDTLYVKYLKSGPWRKVYDDYRARMVPIRPAVAMLGTRYPADGSQLRTFTMQAYQALRSLAAMGVDISAQPYFTDEELAACWKTDNLQHWLERTHTPFSGVPAAASAPLLRQIVHDIDTLGLQSTGIGAFLYFGHAETLMPLLSLMNMPGCNAPQSAPDEVWRVWQDWRVVPLGANLDLEVYTSPSGGIYVSAVLNGHRQGASADLAPVAPWKEVRTSWLRQLNELTENLK